MAEQWAHQGYVHMRPDPTVWEWDVVGDKLMTVKVPREVSWKRRFITKIILGSTWTRVKKK
jgi:hypothetical protein